MRGALLTQLRFDRQRCPRIPALCGKAHFTEYTTAQWMVWGGEQSLGICQEDSPDSEVENYRKRIEHLPIFALFFSVWHADIPPAQDW